MIYKAPYLKFDFKLSVVLIISFIFMTIIGTLSHEFGHYAVSKFLGYDATINYKSTQYFDKEAEIYLKNTYQKYQNEIKNNDNFPEKEQFFKILHKKTNNSFWITLGGPVQTMLTGTIGLVLLIVYRKKQKNKEELDLWGWILIFLSLFWLRQIANLAMAIMDFLIKGRLPFGGDEMKLAIHLQLNVWSIQVITGLLGLFVLIIVINTIPKSKISTFLISGLIGGGLGYYLWLIRFGQYLMP